MSETANISALANKITDDIIESLKWKKCGPHDEKWTCVKAEHKKKEHPSDVVFYYDDPYSGKTLYLNTDLKSYAANSISAQSTQTALESLALAVDCANVSSDWQDLYLADADRFDKVCGLYFLFNHDNKFIKQWSNVFASIDFDKIKLSENHQIFILNPHTIRQIYNISIDIKSLSGVQKLPFIEECSYFYPDLVLSRTHGGEWNQPATIEAINAPWIILKHKKCKHYEEGYLIYYNQRGDSSEEFLYFIDMLSHYQILISDSPIRVRLTDPNKKAIAFFNKAIIEYMTFWGPDEAKEQRLNSIEINSIPSIAPYYNPLEVGIENNE
jgi:hypothetical protein